jgi:hypothetical protein
LRKRLGVHSFLRQAWQAWFGIEVQVTPELRAAIEATL